MKKVISMLTTLAVFATAAFTSFAAPAKMDALELGSGESKITLNTKTVLNDLSTLEDNSGVGSWNPWGGAVGTVSSHEGSTIKVVYTAGSNPTVGLATVKGALGDNLAVGVKLSATAEINCQFVFDVKSPESVKGYLDGVADAPVYLVASDNTVTALTLSADKYFTIPKDFDGIVIAPLTSIAGTADLSAAEFGFNFKVVNPPACTVVYDDLLAYGYAEPDATSAPTEATTTTTVKDDKVVVPFSSPKVVEDFSNFASEIKDDWSGRFGTWGGNVKFSDFKVESGKLKATYPAGKDMSFSVVVSNPSAEYKATSVWMDTSAVSSVVTIRLLFAAGNKYVSTAKDAICYLVPDSGDVTQVTIGDEGNIDLPQGFKGKIVTPIASYTLGDMTEAEVRSSEKLTMQVKITADVPAGSVILYDDMAYLKAGASTTDPTTPPATGTTAVGALLIGLAVASTAAILATKKSRA